MEMRVIIIVSVLLGIITVFALRMKTESIFSTELQSEFDFTNRSLPVTITQADTTTAGVDPAGYTLSNIVHRFYPLLVRATYCMLAALTFALFLRALHFFHWFYFRSRSNLSDDSLRGAMKHLKGKPWAEFRKKLQTLAEESGGSVFWNILRDAVSTSAVSKEKRYDLLYSYFKRGLEEKWEDNGPKRILDTVAAISPAVGFFGTLLGMLFIFSSAEGAVGRLADTPEFSVGLKVAITTSLWGLFNLTTAVIVQYFAQFFINGRDKRLKVGARHVIALVDETGSFKEIGDERK